MVASIKCLCISRRQLARSNMANVTIYLFFTAKVKCCFCITLKQEGRKNKNTKKKKIHETQTTLFILQSHKFLCRRPLSVEKSYKVVPSDHYCWGKKQLTKKTFAKLLVDFILFLLCYMFLLCVQHNITVFSFFP